MANNQFNLSFVTDLDRGITLTPLRQAFMEDDHQAHVFSVKAMRGGAAVSLAGAAVTGYFIPYGMETAVQLTGSVDAAGVASVALTRDCYAFVGRFHLVIQTVIDGVESSIFYGEGYVTRTRTDKVIEPSGAVPSLGALEQMIKNLTYADVGAAPSGYGLGDVCVTANLASITKTGWYKGAPGSVSGVDTSITQDYWMVRHIEHGLRNEATQRAWYIAGFGDCSIERVRRGSTWGEWGWKNPPMQIGVEYRTTERYMGKPVYAKLVDFGALPAAASKSIEIAAAGVIKQIISRETQGLLGNTFPSYVAGMRIDVATYVGESSPATITITTTHDWYGGSQTYVSIKYTKTTD